MPKIKDDTVYVVYVDGFPIGGGWGKQHAYATIGPAKAEATRQYNRMIKDNHLSKERAKARISIAIYKPYHFIPGEELYN